MKEEKYTPAQRAYTPEQGTFSGHWCVSYIDDGGITGRILWMRNRYVTKTECQAECDRLNEREAARKLLEKK